MSLLAFQRTIDGDNVVFQEVKVPENEMEDVCGWACENSYCVLDEDNLDNVVGVLYNGEDCFSYVWDWEALEEELEEKVVKALKEKGIFSDDTDDEKTIIKLANVIIKRI